MPNSTVGKKGVAEATRLRIQTGMIVARMQAFVLETEDKKTGKPTRMNANQIRAAEILLRKTLPDLAAIAIGTSDDGGLIIEMTRYAKADTAPERLDS